MPLRTGVGAVQEDPATLCPTVPQCPHSTALEILLCGTHSMGDPGTQGRVMCPSCLVSLHMKGPVPSSTDCDGRTQPRSWAVRSLKGAW